MLKARTVLAAAAAFAAAYPVHAQDSELTKLREEMKQLQRSYEDRMQSLEKRLAEAEARAQTAPAPAVAAAQQPPGPRLGI